MRPRSSHTPRTGSRKGGRRYIHVESSDGHAKFWLDPVSLADSDGYNLREIARIRRLVEANRAELRERWRDFFSD